MRRNDPIWERTEKIDRRYEEEHALGRRLRKLAVLCNIHRQEADTN